MKSVAELCRPRPNVFVDTARDDVLNLSDLIEGNIDPNAFFEENFRTKGMNILFQTVFNRFMGKSETGVIRLTQAMGGGKTHNMLALALLAQNPSLRTQILGDTFDEVGTVRVLAFSGRESDAEFGIWGSLAEQLQKKDTFASYYAPLRAPGESAWINLLQGEKTLILLDELPPYLENARSIAIGNSDLCQVTITALSNLFSALGKAQLSNVCLIFSDLKATYESGSALLQSSFKELENEANRVALGIEPVALNSDEIYDILRKRLFEKVPFSTEDAVKEIAVGFKEAVSRAGKSGLTNYPPDKVFIGVRDSYPFHPSIKDLYARFKENQGFQQTRGLIRLMRQIVRQFYESGAAEKAYLLNVYDVDLNNQLMLNRIKEIKPSLDNAISHDIAQQGKAVAETIDAEYEDAYDFPYAQTAAKLLLVSSLNETAHGLQGLNDSDILGYLCAPGLDMNQYKKVLEEIKAQSWYLKMDNRGRYYFQNTKNMVAEMNTLVDSYSDEQARKDLRKFLEGSFAPKLKKCYELLYVMPAIDEIELDMKKTALVIYEPYEGSGMHPDLQSFYENATYKNRVMFLTGQRSIMRKLFDNSKRLTAIRQIISAMKDEHVSETDQQYREAQAQEDKALTALLSTIRETFITLYFPTKSGLTKEDFKLAFTNNKFIGEDQIVNTLSGARKFEDFSSEDRFLDTLRKKCEARIFTQQEMTWQQIQERAATETIWQWYNPSQMETLKKDCLNRDKWREIGGYLQKGPFAKEPTEVQVEQLSFDPETKEYTLKVRGIHGNTVYYDIGSVPSEASAVAPNPFVTKETELWFLCVDKSHDDPHPTGEPYHFFAHSDLKYEQRETSEGMVMEMRVNPGFEIRYTTDGSNPKESGGKYLAEFPIPKNCNYVRAALYLHGVFQYEKQLEISRQATTEKLRIDDSKSLEYTMREMKKCGDTASTYEELSNLQKLPGTFVRHFTVILTEKERPDNYVELTSGNVIYDAGNLQATIDIVRDSAFAGKDVIVEFEYKVLRFVQGATFKRWIDMNKLDLNEIRKHGEIVQ